MDKKQKGKGRILFRGNPMRQDLEQEIGFSQRMSGAKKDQRRIISMRRELPWELPDKTIHERPEKAQRRWGKHQGPVHGPARENHESRHGKGRTSMNSWMNPETAITDDTNNKQKKKKKRRGESIREPKV